MNSTEYDVCIIGAGISGLSTAAFLLKQQPGLRVLILEQSARPGGAIRSFRDKGYLAEWGPHGFLDNCEESRLLVGMAGLDQEKVTAPLGTFVRYVCLDGRLQCIPQKPLSILKAPLMPWSAKLRILGDLWKRPLPGEPTVAQWIRYRFGEALVPFADAVFTGTYAGDIDRLKIDAVMPGIRKIEQESGSVIRGMIKKMRTASGKRQGETKQLPAMTSFIQGMGMLPERLAEKLSTQALLRFHSGVSSLHREQDGWRVIAGSEAYRSSQVVLALPVNRSLELLTAALPDRKPPCAAVAESQIISVLLGLSSSAAIPFGFGYLAPEQERRFALGALFSTHMFPGRAPEKHQLLEVLVGGRRHPERVELADDELIERALADLRQLMALPEPPTFTAVLRPSGGIPQLEEGYTDLLAWRRAVQAAHADLHICGFGWKGIGINDMIKEAMQIASLISTQVAPQEKIEVKGVYF